MGTIFSIFTLIGGFYDGVYWNPVRIYALPFFGFGVEDFFYMFGVGGLASVSYEFFYHKVHKRTRSDSNFELRKTQILMAFIAGIAVAAFIGSFVEINVILSHTLGLFVIAVVLIFFEPKFIKPMLLNAITFGVFIMIVEAISGLVFPGSRDFWPSSTTLGVNILGFPIEEFLFHMAWGATASCVYEFYLGLKDTKYSSKEQKEQNEYSL
ncbi:hypothetical protein HYV12_01840 [Candidatus Dojkabacteria bacterium]|nr:hypothetical protein [Candidatus Dojkabacteria bacterium]